MDIVIGLLVLGAIVWGGWALVRFATGRPCPKCGARVHSGEVNCKRCGYSFLEEGEIQIRQLRALDSPADLSEGWKVDPLKPEQLRWWDGKEWKPKVGIRKSDGGAESA